MMGLPNFATKRLFAVLPCSDNNNKITSQRRYKGSYSLARFLGLDLGDDYDNYVPQSSKEKSSIIMTRREQRLLITSLVFLGALCQWSDARKLLAPLSSTALKNLPRGGGSELSATTIVDDEDAAAAYRSPLLNQNSGEEEDLVATNTGKVLVGGSSSATVTVTAQEGASIPNEVFNLVKSIVGAGVLGLPAGIAAFGGTSMALVPAISLMVVAGILSGYCFSLIGRVCAYTGAKSYRQAWERTVSSKTAWIPAAACFMVTSCSVLAYSMILSDTIPSLANSLGGLAMTRTQALLGVTTVALLPLCLMKSLKSLGPFSLVGIIGMVYTSLAMCKRWLDGSYGVTGRFIDDLDFDLSPRFGRPEDLLDVILNPNLFLLVSMLSTAFMAHFNAPKFYLELKNNTLPRYNTVVGVSFFISLALFVAVSSFGFLTFGKACSGLVLNNYANEDKLMSLSRIAVALSILFSYPLAFVGVRDGLLDLLKVEKRPDSLLNTVTVILLTIVTGIAYVLTDLRKLLAVAGATWGNAVIYILPTYMFVQCAKKLRPDLKSEVPIVALTGVIGLGMGLVGTAIALDS